MISLVAKHHMYKEHLAMKQFETHSSFFNKIFFYTTIIQIAKLLICLFKLTKPVH